MTPPNPRIPCSACGDDVVLGASRNLLAALLAAACIGGFVLIPMALDSAQQGHRTLHGSLGFLFCAALIVLGLPVLRRMHRTRDERSSAAL